MQPVMPLFFRLALGNFDAPHPFEASVKASEFPILKLRIERDPHIRKVTVIFGAQPKNLRHFEVVAVLDVQYRVGHGLRLPLSSAWRRARQTSARGASRRPT